MHTLNDTDVVKMSLASLRKLIDEAVEKGREDGDKLLDKAVKRGKEESKIETTDYFKATERLLYDYPLLKEKVDQDETLLQDPDLKLEPVGRSKDIVHISNKKTRYGLDPEAYTQGLKTSMMRTRIEVMRIEKALMYIADDPYYEIIPKKYFEDKTFEKIAEEFSADYNKTCDESTIRRHRSRLIKTLMKLLFGADAVRISPT